MRRWGIFWRKIEADLDRVPLIVSVCMKLHNVCVESRLLEIETCFEDGRWRSRNAYCSDVRAPDSPFVYLRSECASELSPLRHERERSEKRDSLCAALKTAGLRRPALGNKRK